MQNLIIDYPNGNITLNVRGFFPVPQAQFKGIVKKIISRAEDRDDKVKDLADEFREYIRENEEEAKGFAKRYVDNRTLAAELRAEAGKMFHPNGSRITDDEFKEMKRRIREYESRSKSALHSGNALLRKNEKLQKHIEILNEVRW